MIERHCICFIFLWYNSGESYRWWHLRFGKIHKCEKQFSSTVQEQFMNISNTPPRNLDSRASFFISERSFQKPTRQSLRASTLTLAEGLLISTKSVRKWMMLKVCELGAGRIFQALLPRYEQCVTVWPAQCMRVWHHTCNPIPVFHEIAVDSVVWSDRQRG